MSFHCCTLDPSWIFLREKKNTKAAEYKSLHLETKTSFKAWYSKCMKTKTLLRVWMCAFVQLMTEPGTVIKVQDDNRAEQIIYGGISREHLQTESLALDKLSSLH